ncbi:MAG: RdgB/HAM1 family non-canonical purine NTP pyrophosphatase [Myxococcales bacterium]|nr:RdgB/HAM1 family non-canonical purine NTP pyrophosphatase [Myxococcales bacterium]
MTRATRPLVIATGNPHKLDEYRDLLPGVPLASLADYPPAPAVDETAPDFAGNAILKARAAAAHTGHPALADDSGLEVRALAGAPGVHSARYAPGTDADRYHKLLAALDGVTDRRARFICVIAVAGLPEGLPLPDHLERRHGCILARGHVTGAITHAPRGAHGFGYDPIFQLPTGRTAAELDAADKHAISHRGHAARAIAPLLARFFG